MYHKDEQGDPCFDTGIQIYLPKTLENYELTPINYTDLIKYFTVGCCCYPLYKITDISNIKFCNLHKIDLNTSESLDLTRLKPENSLRYFHVHVTESNKILCIK